MSRSYKKTPYCGDKKGKQKKRIANKKVRSVFKRSMRKDDPDVIQNHGHFKREYEQYDVCDFFWIKSWNAYWNDTLRDYNSMKSYFRRGKMKEPNKKEAYQKWRKTYKRK